MTANRLSGSIYYGPRYGGNVITPGARPGGPSKTIGAIVQRSSGSGGQGMFVYSGANQVGSVDPSGATTSRYPRRMPSGYIATRAEAQSQADK